MNNQSIKTCDECGSSYNSESSSMANLCPECAHLLYGYENCPHVFINGRCAKCFWDGSASDHTKKLKEIKPLVSLLEISLELAGSAECLAAITGREEVRLESPDMSIPLKGVIEIYTTRSEINNGRIKGYETLLPNLEAADVQNIRIHSLELLEKRYIIFTDETVSHLFGLLHGLKGKAAWFDHEEV